MNIVERWRPYWKLIIEDNESEIMNASPLQKRKPIRSKVIRDAANGESCTVCGRNDGTTVFCHLNESWAGKGIGQKADDLGGGFFGCGECHDVYDNRIVGPRHSDMAIMRAVYRTIRRLYEKSIIQINGDNNG